MRKLDPKEMNIVAGGGTPGLVCSTTGDAANSEKVCQTSSGLTVITTKNTIDVGGEIGITGKIKEILGGKVEGHWKETTTQQTICKPSGECQSLPPTVTKEKVSDISGISDAQNLAFDQLGYDLGNFDAFAGGGDYGGGGDYDAGCVQIASFLPGGGVAGDIKVGATMQLSDQVTLEAGTGEVSFSKRKKAQGFRVTTVSGVTLICSDTAPIPTPEGLVLAPNLAGKQVAVRRDEGGVSHGGWEAVKSLEHVGEIEVQHITVGNKCFWAGERPHSYILHHNMKNAGGGSGSGSGGDEYLDEIDWDYVA